MTIGIIGLGLIGGSIAKAAKEKTGARILGCDISEPVVCKARLVGAIDEPLSDENLAECELVIVALYPNDTVAYVIEKAPLFRKGAVVVDCGGVKRPVCEALRGVARENGFCFVGGHPMAGIEHSGFEYSKKNLFERASFIVTPYPETGIEVLETLKKFFLAIGFSRFQISTPAEHDKLIALTSQMAHVVSSAYVKSPNALRYKGFSAGSFKDMTRVAKLNENMWTELFLANSDNLVGEIDSFIERMTLYRQAIAQADAVKLRELLKEGREIKQSLSEV
ncbi:MAG: prephenate dehydrogenase [Firmicutes bacterium ADurb.Bin262]|nr:MAG: prephenate dehydrogenase [Firmicutes bacterium ADurb.Bin262]